MGTKMSSLNLSSKRFKLYTKFTTKIYHNLKCVKIATAVCGKNSTPKGVSSVKDETVRNNLMGVSPFMNKKGWVDSQGRKGKGYGVYRYASKYGANVDGYSPIYSPDEWTETGNTFSLGTKGLLAWAGLLVVLLAVGINAVISTSSLG